MRQAKPQRETGRRARRGGSAGRRVHCAVVHQVMELGVIMLRVFLATTNIFVSLIFGALAMGVVWYVWPETMQNMFHAANGVKAWLVSLGIEPSTTTSSGS